MNWCGSAAGFSGQPVTRTSRATCHCSGFNVRSCAGKDRLAKEAGESEICTCKVLKIVQGNFGAFFCVAWFTSLPSPAWLRDSMKPNIGTPRPIGTPRVRPCSMVHCPDREFWNSARFARSLGHQGTSGAFAWIPMPSRTGARLECRRTPGGCTQQRPTFVRFQAGQSTRRPIGESPAAREC